MLCVVDCRSLISLHFSPGGSDAEQEEEVKNNKTCQLVILSSFFTFCLPDVDFVQAFIVIGKRLFWCTGVSQSLLPILKLESVCIAAKKRGLDWEAVTGQGAE